MKQFLSAIIFVTSLLATLSPAYSRQELGKVGWWDISYQDDGICVARSTFGDTLLSIGYHAPDRDWNLFIKNEAWQSIVPNKKYEIDLVVEGIHTWNAVAWGTENNGLLTESLKFEVIRHLAEGNILRVDFGGQSLKRFSLKGSSKTVAALINCYENHQDPFESDTKDPFKESNFNRDEAVHFLNKNLGAPDDSVDYCGLYISDVTLLEDSCSLFWIEKYVRYVLASKANPNIRIYIEKTEDNSPFGSSTRVAWLEPGGELVSANGLEKYGTVATVSCWESTKIPKGEVRLCHSYAGPDPVDLNPEPEISSSEKVCYLEVDKTVHINELCTVFEEGEVLQMVSALKIFSGKTELYTASISLDMPNELSWNQGNATSDVKYPLGEVVSDGNGCWSNDRARACITDVDVNYEPSFAEQAEQAMNSTFGDYDKIETCRLAQGDTLMFEGSCGVDLVHEGTTQEFTLYTSTEYDYTRIKDDAFRLYAKRVKGEDTIKLAWVSTTGETDYVFGGFFAIDPETKCYVTLEGSNLPTEFCVFAD